MKSHKIIENPVNSPFLSIFHGKKPWKSPVFIQNPTDNDQFSHVPKPSPDLPRRRGHRLQARAGQVAAAAGVEQFQPGEKMELYPQPSGNMFFCRYLYTYIISYLSYLVCILYIYIYISYIYIYIYILRYNG